MKTRQDNDMSDYTNVVYANNETELLWLIRSGMVYDENQIGQWRDQTSRYNYTKNDIEQSWLIK